VDIFAVATKPQLSNVMFVMRHGRTVLDDENRSDGWLDYPLSDDGRVGLISAQQYLKSAPITHVYANSLRRVHETAHIIASGILTQPEVTDVDVTRTWNLGTLIGTKKKPNRPVVTYYMTHPDQAPEGGESMNDFRQRALTWVFGRCKKLEQGGGPILLVTSGSVVREISFALTGDRDTLDLDESGLLMLIPHGGKCKGKVIFGHKSEKGEYFS
jgi:broad specificity phosphatase PhoE